MKRLFPLALVVLLTVAIRTAPAQTITLQSLAKSTLCAGDTAVAYYSSTGTFASNNLFRLQLSSDNFATFTYIGSATSDIGFISVQLSTPGTYQLRMVSTHPYLTSETVPLQVVAIPTPAVHSDGKCSVSGFVGDSISFIDQSTELSGSTFAWTFDQDANILSSTAPSVKVVYMSTGFKTGHLTVTNSFGCSVSVGFTIQVISCNPVIPKNVHIVSGTESGSDAAVWVQAGESYTVNNEFGFSTVFAEAGSQVVAAFRSNALYYLKPGTSFSSQDDQGCGVVVVTPGVTIPSDPWNPNEVLRCADLTFDYSQVSGGVTEEQQAPQISIHQTADHLFARLDGEPIEIHLLNLLGNEVLSKEAIGEADLDLSEIANGVYFAVVQSGQSRGIKKIVVTH